MRAIWILGLVVSAGVSLQPPQADLLITNGRVFTGVPSAPWAEAIAIRGERIVAVGAAADVEPYRSAATRVIDARGRLVIPGINDAHAHPGAQLPHTTIDGPPAFEVDPSLAEVVARVKRAVRKKPTGEWLIGEIGANVLLDPKATRFIFDPLTAGRPLALVSWHGHGALFNTAALRRLRVSEIEPDPPGGFFVRVGTSQRITGVAHEYADWILRQRLTATPGAAAQAAAITKFSAEAAAFGVTTVQAMMIGYPAAKAAPIYSRANPPVRFRLIDFPMTGLVAWREPLIGPDTARLYVSGTKFILDGTPVERLMWTREPYSDDKNSSGRPNFPPSEWKVFLDKALAVSEQPLFHVVGDKTIDVLLDTLDASGGAKWAAVRPRLEHADMFEPAHVERAKRVGAVVVQNPSHLMLPEMMRARLGERIVRVSQLKTIVASGVPLAFGSDGPLNPFLNIMFATINATNPSQALTVEQALVAYTRGSAYAELAEKEKGTLAPGMLADLAVLSQDIFRIPPPELPKTVSILTIVGGRVVHEQR